MKKLNQYTKYIRPILVLEKYNSNEDVNNQISSIIADRFISSSNFIYEHKIDNQGVGIIGGSIGKVKGNDLDCQALLEIGSKYPEYQDQVQFQIRIMNKIAELDSGLLPEINCFCSLDRTKGIGKLLISKWEQELLNHNIHKYHLFTDANCNYEWYSRNGYQLVNQALIKIDDLDNIKKHHKAFYIYEFEKEI